MKKVLLFVVIAVVGCNQSEKNEYMEKVKEKHIEDSTIWHIQDSILKSFKYTTFDTITDGLQQYYFLDSSHSYK